MSRKEGRDVFYGDVLEAAEWMYRLGIRSNSVFLHDGFLKCTELLKRSLTTNILKNTLSLAVLWRKELLHAVLCVPSSKLKPV